MFLKTTQILLSVSLLISSSSAYAGSEDLCDPQPCITELGAGHCEAPGMSDDEKKACYDKARDQFCAKAKNMEREDCKKWLARPRDGHSPMVPSADEMKKVQASKRAQSHERLIEQAKFGRHRNGESDEFTDEDVVRMELDLENADRQAKLEGRKPAKQKRTSDGDELENSTSKTRVPKQFQSLDSDLDGYTGNPLVR